MLGSDRAFGFHMDHLLDFLCGMLCEFRTSAWASNSCETWCEYVQMISFSVYSVYINNVGSSGPF